MSLSKYFRILFAASVAVAGCEDPPLELDDYRAQVIGTNGFSLNGFSLNGFSLNGFSLNGFSLNGFSLNGFSLNGSGNQVVVPGITLSDFELNGVKLTSLNQNSIQIIGSQLSVTVPATRKTYTGNALKGFSAKFTFPATASAPATSTTLRIDSVTLDTTNKFKDVWLYQVSSKSDTSNVWQSACKDYAGQPAPLIPLMGAYWDEKTGNRVDDSRSFTLACVEGAIGKCVSAGYRPWTTGELCKTPGRNCTDVSLKDYHQACTRMIRADYCGDGIPHTVNGTVLDIFDYLSPPVQLREETWQLEARWQPTGAICISKRRHPEIEFKGCLRTTDKQKTPTLVQPPVCQPYSTGDDRGLVVSTFDLTP